MLKLILGCRKTGSRPHWPADCELLTPILESNHLPFTEAPKWPCPQVHGVGKKDLLIDSFLKQPYCSCTRCSLPCISGAVNSGTVWGFSNKKRIGFFLFLTAKFGSALSCLPVLYYLSMSCSFFFPFACSCWFVT